MWKKKKKKRKLVLNRYANKRKFTWIPGYTQVSHENLEISFLILHPLSSSLSKVAPKKGIFFGYSESSKAYRVYIPKQQKVEVRWDVIFDDTISYWKCKEVSMDAMNEKDHEASKEESSSSREHPKETKGPCDPIERVFVP